MSKKNDRKTVRQPKDDIADDEMNRRRQEILHEAFGDDEPRILGFDEIEAIMNRHRGNR